MAGRQVTVDDRVARFLWPTVLAVLGALLLIIMNGMGSTLSTLKLGQDDGNTRLTKIEATLVAAKDSAADAKAETAKIETRQEEFERRLNRLEIINAQPTVKAAH